MNARLITEYDDYISFLIDRCSKEPLYISSFGLWAGITCTGKDMYEKEEIPPSQARLLRELNTSGQRHRLLVSWSPFECKEGCPACRANNQKKDAYLKNHVSHYNNIGIKVVGRVHMKMALGKEWYVIGGMNLTGSGFSDCCITGSNQKIYNQAFEYFRKTWTESKPVTLPEDRPRITFGKYKGEIIEDIEKSDPQYLSWARNKGIIE